MQDQNYKFSGVPPKCLCWQGEDACFPCHHLGCHDPKGGCHGGQGQPGSKITVSLLVFNHTNCVILNSEWGSQCLSVLVLNLDATDSSASCGSHESSKWARRSIIFARNVNLGMRHPQERRAWPGLASKPRCLLKTRLYTEDRLLTKGVTGVSFGHSRTAPHHSSLSLNVYPSLDIILILRIRLNYNCMCLWYGDQVAHFDFLTNV